MSLTQVTVCPTARRGCHNGNGRMIEQWGNEHCPSFQEIAGVEAKQSLGFCNSPKCALTTVYFVPSFGKAYHRTDDGKGNCTNCGYALYYSQSYSVYATQKKDQAEYDRANQLADEWAFASAQQEKLVRDEFLRRCNNHETQIRTAQEMQALIDKIEEQQRREKEEAAKRARERLEAAKKLQAQRDREARAAYRRWEREKKQRRMRALPIYAFFTKDELRPLYARMLELGFDPALLSEVPISHLDKLSIGDLADIGLHKEAQDKLDDAGINIQQSFGLLKGARRIFVALNIASSALYRETRDMEQIKRMYRHVK